MNWESGVIYAKDAAKGSINVCNDVRIASQRFLDQYENNDWKWVFDERFPQHVLNFAQTGAGQVTVSGAVGVTVTSTGATAATPKATAKAAVKAKATAKVDASALEDAPF